MSDSESPWYAKGLRFECTQCGNCCTGPPGAVWFTAPECRAMAAVLGLDEATFRRRHARKVDGRWTLRETLTEHGYDCVFLDRESQPGIAGCRLYEARPSQCRSWPFWPENLESKASWDSARTQTPCPGMGHGPLISVESITAQLQQNSGR